MDGFLVEIHGEKEQEFLKSQIKFLEVRRLLSLLLWSSVYFKWYAKYMIREFIDFSSHFRR